MNVLLLGSGGREHALARALAPSADKLICVPGNPGIAELGQCLSGDILNGEEMAKIAAEHEIDLVVIGPEAPLVAGVADTLREAGFPVFGPSAAAARLEGSKTFAKEVMALADVPTAMARICATEQEISEALDLFPAPYVVKDDGLAAGKGVVVTEDRAAALAHGVACVERGGTVVVEEYLDGPEISLFCISDGKAVLPLEPAQDFKRLEDGDEGPNTGGMGAYSPLPWAPEDLTEQVVGRIAQPVVDEMARQGTPFIGLLYCGLALTYRGLRVIEFNARFGDPETQVVLDRLATPLAPVLLKAATGKLAGTDLTWHDHAAVTVVLASEGYPGKVRTGVPLEVGDAIQAGTKQGEDGIVTSGGRVLCVMGRGDTVAQAREDAYANLVPFEGAQWRTDIAAGI